MSKKLTVKYPWDALPSYGGFFVPTLDVAKTREEGLKEGIRIRMWGKAEPAIKDGKLGVLFTIGAKQRGRPLQTQSLPDEAHPTSPASLAESYPEQL
jgi:hypothetical protein